MVRKIYNFLHRSLHLKIFCLIFISCSFGLEAQTAQITATTYAQQNEIVQKISLEKALDQLAERYEANLVYDDAHVKDHSVKSSDLKGKKIEMVLKKILVPLKLSFKKISQKSYVIKPASKSKQQPSSKNLGAASSKTTPVKIKKIQVRGIVADKSTSEPLIGVNVTDKKNQVGTATDLDGAYSLEVDEDAILEFSYVGYNSLNIKVEGRSVIDVLLSEDTEQLDEVVVVGYGSQRRSDLTGSLSSVSSEELKQTAQSSLDQALQGRAAGVLVTQNSGAPGGGVSIRIRGIGSTLTAEPLYVIDGIPVVNDNQGTSTNFSELDGGGQNPNALNTINPNDIESIEILKDASATAIYGARAANGVVLITTKRGESGRSNLSFETYYGVQEIARKVPVMNLRQYADYFDDISWFDIDEFERPELLGEGTDWQDEVFRKAGMQNYQLTMSGGSDKTTFALSGGFHSKEGIVIGSKFNRMSSRLNIDHKFTDKIRVGNSLLVSKTSENITFNDNSSGVIYTALLMVPNAPVRNVDGSFAGPTEEITLSFDNPVARALDTKDVNEKTRILGNIYAEMDIMPWLTYRTEFGTDLVFTNHNTFFPSFERGNFFGKSGIRKSISNSTYWINKHLLTFKKKIKENHNVTTLLGFEAQAGEYEYLYASRENLPNNELTQISLGDAGQQQTNGGAGHWALMSYFGRVNYGFSDRYLLTATVRVDGSSRFGANNRYGTFPSAAFAWRASNEKFLKKVDALSNLKFRIGYGAVGNQEIGLYSYASNLRALNTVMGDQLITSFGIDNIANPNVRWESSFQTNIGVDFGLFNNRFEIIADYYIKKAEGMLLPALIPLTAGGLNPPFVNIGEIENRGFEFTLKTVNIAGKFEWKTGLNFSINRNKVLNLGSNGNLIGTVQRLPVTRTVEGQPISLFYGYVMEGIFQTQAEVVESPFQSNDTRAGDIKFQDLNDDGMIDDSDQTFIGNPHPDFTFNITNDFSFKNFDLSIFIQGVQGNDVLNIMKRDTEGLAGLRNQVISAIDRFTTANPSNTVPRATGSDPNSNRRISTRYIEDGSFIRIKNITLGYNLPNKLGERLKLQNLRIYASTQNLYTWQKYSGYDPEVGSYNQNPLINGVENGRYPIPRSYTFGLNANF